MYLILILLILSTLYDDALTFRQIACDTRKLRKNAIKYIVDIDGTICNTKKSDYQNSIPSYKIIEKFNILYDTGNEVHYWTARGANSGINWDELTIKQLRLWNVKYTSINMNKPHYDVWIDDKAINIDDF